MGCGKTSLGKKVARKMGIPFLDLDEVIAKNEGRSVAEIFENQGENAFREKERQILLDYIQNPESFLMACGGGTPCFFNNMQLMNENGITVYLNLSPARLIGRLKNARENATDVRPLLKNQTDLSKFVKEKLAQRIPFYSKARFSLDEKDAHEKGLQALLESCW